jgi:RNA polymerase sigma-70 factor (ECF subfamily)
MIGTLSATAQPLHLTYEAMPPGRKPAKTSPRHLNAESSFDLLARAHDGNAEALNELCARYLPRLHRWAHGRLPAWARDAVETQDLVQDTLVQVFQKIPAFEPEHRGSFPAYVHMALRNRLLDAIRRAQRRPALEPLDPARPDRGPSPLEAAIGQQTLEQYEAALQRLNVNDQAAIVLRIELGYTDKEIATELCKPSVPAANMAIGRALVRLAKEMSRGRG